MRDTQIFLLAQGSQTRMQSLLDTPKQLITLQGEPMLLRTIRLLRKVRPDSELIAVIPDLPVWDAVKAGVDRWITQTNPTYYQMDILRNMRSTFGSASSVFLHGDVMWSSEALHKIANTQKDFGFCVRGEWNIVTGNGRREVYGFAVSSKGYPLLDSILQQPLVTPCFTVKLLWDLVAQLQEVAFEDTEIIRLPGSDYTDDIDFPDDLRGADFVDEFLQKQEAVSLWRGACGK